MFWFIFDLMIVKLWKPIKHTKQITRQGFVRLGGGGGGGECKEGLEATLTPIIHSDHVNNVYNIWF